MYTNVHIVLYSYYIHTYKMYTNIHEKVQTTEYDKQIIECVNKQPFYTEKKNNTNWSSEKTLTSVYNAVRNRGPCIYVFRTYNITKTNGKISTTSTDLYFVKNTDDRYLYLLKFSCRNRNCTQSSELIILP